MSVSECKLVLVSVRGGLLCVREYYRLLMSVSEYE